MQALSRRAEQAPDAGRDGGQAARHVLFPDDGGADWFALAVAVGAFLLAWRFHVPIHYLVLIGAVLGMAWTLAT